MLKPPPSIHHAVVYQASDGSTRRNSYLPSLCRFADGGLLAAWRIGSVKDSADGTVGFASSSDDGRTWSEAVLPFDRPQPGQPGTFMLDGVPGNLHYASLTALPNGNALAMVMWLDRSDPDRPMFNDETEGLTTVHTLLSESSDRGKTWSEPRLLEAAPFDGLASLCAPALCLPDGRLAAQLEINKPYDDPNPWQQKAILRFSEDGGQTWPTHAVVAEDQTRRLRFWDQRMAVLPDGSLFVALWTYDSVKRCDVNIHFATSQDGGATWTPPRDSGIPYQLSYPVALSDGRVALLAVQRFDSPSIRLLISDDGGRSFDMPGRPTYQQQVAPDGSQENKSLGDQQLWLFGRVEAVATPSDDVMAIYYAGQDTPTAIHFNRIDLNAK